MSFEKLKRDLSAYDGHSKLTLEERLALFHSLESELTELTGKPLEGCVVTAEDCEAGSVISDMAWFGNLFHNLYAKNQATVEEYAGRILRRFLNGADSASDSLNKTYEELQTALKNKKNKEAQNSALEKEIAALKLEMSDMDKVKLRYFELIELKKQEEKRFADLVPYDLDGAQRELSAIRQKIADAQCLYEKQKEQMNSEQARCQQELDDWTSKVFGLTIDNTQIEEKIAEQRKIAIDLQAKKSQIESELSALGVDALRAEIQQLTSDIDNYKNQREQDLQTHTQLKVDLAQAKESNERFFRNHVEPIQQELSQVQSQGEVLEAERIECVEFLKELTEKLEDTRKAIPEIKEKIDLQKSNLNAAQTILSNTEEKLNTLTAEIAQKDDKKKKLDEEILSAEAALLGIDTQISTLELQSIPSLNDKIKNLNEKQASLLQDEQDLTAELETLEKNVAEKAEEVEKINDAREQKQNELGRLNANLESLIQQNQALEADLQKGNPEETRRNLQNENARLLEALEEFDKLRIALSEKENEVQAQVKANEELSERLNVSEETYASLTESCNILSKRLGEMKDSGFFDELDKLKTRQEFLLDVSEALRNLKNQILPNAELQNDSEFIRQAILTLGKQLDSLQNQLTILRDRFKENVL